MVQRPLAARTAEILYHFQPDYAAAPGAVLAERLAIWEMSQAEFARRCGRSPSLIRRIIAGIAPVTPETARQMAVASDLKAEVWLNIERAYRDHLAREAERIQAAPPAAAD